MPRERTPVRTALRSAARRQTPDGSGLRRGAIAICLALAAFCCGGIAQAGGVSFASAGDLDGTFGSGGKVLLPSAPDLYGWGYGGMSVQSDGKIVVTGGVFDSSSGDFVTLLIRLDVDGTLDSTFGTGGVVKTDLGASGSGVSGGSAVAVDADGKILVAGTI